VAESAYLPLAAGLAAIFAVVALAAPVFALADFGAAGAFVDFAALDFAAIPEYLRVELLTPVQIAGCLPVSASGNRGNFRL
jgi:hypothetical protein